MSISEKHGTPWTNSELDAIVDDYFSMLLDDLVGRPYVKAHHSNRLMQLIGRTHRSVEFKHQNISAVMDKLGLPWIPGYRPKPNYQNAIFDAIDRYLTNQPEILQFAPNRPPLAASPTPIFVPHPVLSVTDDSTPEGLRRLIRKFDPVERDKRNRSLGRAGEAFVVEVERARLSEGRRGDLAHKVRWVADKDGDGAGFDVLSFGLDGAERLIEVKTTNGAARTPFFISRNEFALASERPDDWVIYRVHLFAKDPHIFLVAPPLASTIRLTPEVWRASF